MLNDFGVICLDRPMLCERIRPAGERADFGVLFEDFQKDFVLVGVFP
jgi:hypothetical protein